MRKLHTFDSPDRAHRFRDVLEVAGIASEVETDEEGAELWVEDDRDLERAEAELKAFLEDPDQDRFQNAGRAAERARRKRAREDTAGRRRVVDARTAAVGRSARAGGVGMATLVLIAVCLMTFGLLYLTGRNAYPQALFIQEFENEFGLPLPHRPFLADVRQGQVWRLFTPMFLHFGMLHLIFNMWWLKELGTMIETRESLGRLVLLVAVSAGISNLAQYAWAGPNFGGMSGVVYALLGYIWAKSRFEPGSHLALARETLMIMMIWLFVCMIPGFMNIANAAHVAGLVSGGLLGWVGAGGWRRWGRPRLGG